MIKAAVYCRVSTDQQNTAMQEADLTAYAAARGYEVFRVYKDVMSGTTSSRPELDAMMGDARKRRFGVVLCWRFDRFARSTKHLLSALDEFRHLGIDFVSFQENIDTSNPLGRAVFTIVSAVAELERNLIVERVRAGVRRARESGKHIGRPAVPAGKINEAVRLKALGWSTRKIAAEVGMSTGAVHRAVTAVPKPL